MALTDGETIHPLVPASDYKRAADGDEGPNTGGMGAYAPTPFYDDITRIRVGKEVGDNFLRGLAGEGLDFRGIIYFGLMLTDAGPKVLEFNVRLGDPEAQAILPLIDSDMFAAFMAVARGELSKARLQIKPAACCTVVIASKGYPGAFQTGYPIGGLDDAPRSGKAMIFHAGTKKSDTGFVTNGGRVLNVTGLGPTLERAVVHSYQAVKRIRFKNMHFRNDIAAKAFRNAGLKKRISRMKKRHTRRAALLGS